MTAAVNLTAYLCEQMGTTPDAVVASYPEGEAPAVMDHSELARLGLASGHADITHWMRRYGKRMRDFRAEVAAAMTGVWSRVEWEDRTGYMMTEFLRRIESAGNVFRPVGEFRVDFEMT